MGTMVNVIICDSFSVRESRSLSGLYLASPRPRKRHWAPRRRCIDRKGGVRLESQSPMCFVYGFNVTMSFKVGDGAFGSTVSFLNQHLASPFEYQH